MKKVFLSFVAALLCSIVSFAQSQTPTEIKTAEDFINLVGTDGSYKLMADINLGTYDATSNNFVKTSFSGTFDGNNHTITYQGSFTTNGEGDKIGLFESVSGTITNLNIDASITVAGTDQKVRVSLLCGELANDGTISFCDVIGNINSTAKSGGLGNASIGLIIGNNLGDLLYCTGHGNVTGVGYVGGLVGSMGTTISNITTPSTGYIKGCYFTGNVTANNSSTLDRYQSFAGGICGYMHAGATLELCVAEAVIVTGQNAEGIVRTGGVISAGGLSTVPCTVQNTYCSGTVNGDAIDSDKECVEHNAGNWAFGSDVFSNTYNPGTEISCQKTHAECIVDALEEERCPNPNENDCDDSFYFTVSNGKVVLVIEQENQVICEAPINLTVENNGGTYTAKWSVANADNTAIETSFVCKLNGNTLEGTPLLSNGVYSLSLGALQSSLDAYTFTVESDCSANGNTLYSDEVTYSFYIDAECNAVTSLQASVTTTTATISWVNAADTVKLNGNIITLTNGGTLTGLTPATTYTIEAIVNCPRHDDVNNTLSTSLTFTTEATAYVTAQTGPFFTASTWVGGKVPTGNADTKITIREGHTVNLDGTFVLYGEIINKGILHIGQSGQLINKNDNINVGGIVEVETGQKTIDAWTFIGAPFAGYKLNAVMPVSGSDVAMVKYNYTGGNWSSDWAHVGTSMKAAEGTIAWPFYGGVITFTTYGDLCTWNANANNGQGAWVAGTYNYAKTPDYKLNNDNVTITEENLPADGGRWMALSNPYPAKLSVTKFVNANNIANYSDIQGKCIYRLDTTITTENGVTTTNYHFDPIFSGDIAMTEGFFVNLASGNYSVTFSKEQLKDWPGQKSQVNPTEFIELSLVKGNHKSKLYLAHNEEAEQGYDIFDANKMFALSEIAEPYFVTEGNYLVKEEFAELPYYATMNVRSFADDTVSFVVNNIPEGYAVSIIDGEEVIDLVEGGVYSTEILTGENADRFKVLVKKNVGLADVEELDVTIVNSNRHITITAQEDVKVTVYNTLGQRVFETEETNFVLSGVASGAYVVKVQGAKAAKSQKIVVE